jgi:hypothetical protein
MFRLLLAHPQEAIHKRNLIYCNSTAIVAQPSEITHTKPSADCVAPAEDEQVMLETCRGP